MHTRTRYRAGRFILVSEYIPGNYGAPGIKRAPRRKRTPDEIQEQNRSNRVRNLQRLILANFQEGDYHLILTYRKADRPGTFEEGKKRLSDFLKKMRREYAKAGIPLKWIAVTERGERGAIHHHLIIENRDYVTTKMVVNNITGKLECRACGTDMLVKQLWKYGRPQLSMLDNPEEDGAHAQLSSYFVKDKTKEGPEEEPGNPEEPDAGKLKRRNMVHYSRSRNLIVPQPERKLIHRRIRIGDPRIPKGYEVLKYEGLPVLETGTNPVTGYPWQRYVLVKINPTRD